MATLAELEGHRDQAQVMLEYDTFQLRKVEHGIKRDAKAFRLTVVLFTLSFLCAFLLLDPLMILFAFVCTFCSIMVRRVLTIKQNTLRLENARAHHADSLTKFVDKLQEVEDRKQMQLMDPKAFQLLETEKQRAAEAKAQLARLALKAKEDELEAKFERDKALAMAFAEASGDKERQQRVTRLVWRRDDDGSIDDWIEMKVWGQSYEN